MIFVHPLFGKFESVTKITMMTVSAVQFQTGLRLPVEDIGELCHKYNCLLPVDAIQCVGATPIDFNTILSAGGHKWLMSVEGSGILYAAEHTHHSYHQLRLAVS